MSTRVNDRRRVSTDGELRPGVDTHRAPAPMALGASLYATPRNTNSQEYFRPRTWGFDTKRAIEQYDWFELLEYSRQLVTQRGNLGWAVAQKNRYAVGDAWLPQYLGNNTAWGEELEAWLTQVWYPQCDIRGGVFDFQTNLWLTGLSMDVDGDDTVLFAIRDDGFPLLKFCMAHEIASAGDNEIKGGGALDGARIDNGILLDRNKRFVGVRIVNEDAPPTDVPAAQCQLLFEPDWRNVCRGVPRVGKAILDWLDVEDIDTFLKRGVKLDASIGLLHYSEDGGAPTGTDLVLNRGTNNTNTDVDPADVKFEKRLGGEIYYMRAGKGERIEGFKGERPHPNSEQFVQRIERRGMLAIDWFYEMMDPSKIGGASTRLIQDQVRASIRARQKNLKKRALRVLHFAVMQAQQAGFVRKNPDPDDQFRWGFTLPALPCVDQGYEADADREAQLMGNTTMANVCGKAGNWWQDVRKQQATENKDWIDQAIALVNHARASAQELSFAKALEMVKQSSPNATAQTKEQEKQKQPDKI